MTNSELADILDDVISAIGHCDTAHQGAHRDRGQYLRRLEDRVRELRTIKTPSPEDTLTTNGH